MLDWCPQHTRTHRWGGRPGGGVPEPTVACDGTGSGTFLCGEGPPPSGGVRGSSDVERGGGGAGPDAAAGGPAEKRGRQGSGDGAA